MRGHHYGGLKRERKIRKGVFCEDGENRGGVKGALNFVNGSLNEQRKHSDIWETSSFESGHPAASPEGGENFLKDKQSEADMERQGEVITSELERINRVKTD